MQTKSILGFALKRVVVHAVLVAAVLTVASCPGNGDIPVTGVTLNVTDWSQQPWTGTCCTYEQQLIATVHPDDATNKNVTWASSDPGYTVSADGLVSGCCGQALVVTVTTEDGDFTATCSGSASCPLVYVGDGSGKFTYLTDLQGPIIGMPGGVSISSRIGMFTEDYVVLNGLKADRDGNYQVKLREIQAEISYIDDVKLIPVDVPDGYEIASSSAERTYGNGYVTPQRFYTVKTPRTLLSATDQDGRDVTAPLRSTDGIPAPIDRTGLPYYTLDFGDFDAARGKLVVEAWALYSPAYTSEGRTLPSIAVKDAAGQWKEVETVGIPAGDEKTIVFDVSGLFPTNDRHIRLNIGSRPWVRWVVDSIRLDDSAQVEPIVGSEIRPSVAKLSKGGLATFTLPDFHSRGAVLDDNLPFNGVGLGQGRFTRYGDVGDLLSRPDDKFAIMGMGDQVLMTFRPLAEARPGYHRVMVLKALHYYKAPNVSTTVAALPFRGMSAYPYPATEHYPDDADHREYLATYNTRVNK